MRSYRDYLDDKNVPRGPWSVLELNNPLVKPEEKSILVPVVKESQNVSGGPNL